MRIHIHISAHGIYRPYLVDTLNPSIDWSKMEFNFINMNRGANIDHHSQDLQWIRNDQKEIYFAKGQRKN